LLPVQLKTTPALSSDEEHWVAPLNGSLAVQLKLLLLSSSRPSLRLSTV
jgi:hypothetical protein